MVDHRVGMEQSTTAKACPTANSADSVCAGVPKMANHRLGVGKLRTAKACPTTNSAACVWDGLPQKRVLWLIL